MTAKPILMIIMLLVFSSSSFSQEIVCENASCTANDYTLNYFYLGDEFGNEFGPGYCEPGSTVNAHIWTNFVANSAASRYTLYLHFNLYVEGVFVATIDECYFVGQEIPTDVTLDIYDFNWACGSEITLENFYTSWQPNASRPCGCNGAKCYKEEVIVVQAPLIANFEFGPSCASAYTVDFITTTSGGSPPYSFVWDFGDGTSSTLDNPTHSYTSTGPYTVTLTVIDTENTDSYEFEIVNFDANLPPEIYAPPNLNIEGCSLSDIPILNYSETTTEITEAQLNALGGSIVISNSLTSLSYVDTSTGTCPIVISRTFTVVDSCDNVATEIQTITINDTTLPTASNPSPISVQCISDVPSPDTSVITNATDNCSNVTVLFVSDVSDNNTCSETITRTYSVTDDCGNQILLTQYIFIQDDVAPTASNLSSISVQCSDDVPVPDTSLITASDNCSIPTITFVSDVTDGNLCPITITRTYSVTDDCNNETLVTQLIVINDTTMPTATAPADVTVQCLSDIPAPDPGTITDATDNCSVPLVAFVSDTSDNGSCPQTITRLYSVTDECGNELILTQLITVQDDIAPTASAPAAINVQCIADVPAPDTNIISDATDNCSTPLISFISDISTGQCPQIITRTYRVSDDCGNFIDIIQDINVTDTILPTASNPAPININCSDSIPSPDITVVTDEADNCSTPVVAFVSDTSDGQCPETIVRVYSITDACGNSINVTQDIIRNDTEAPTLSSTITDSTVSCTAIPNAPNLVFDDNCTTNLTVVFTETNTNVDNTIDYDITRTWTVTDSCGNQSTFTQSIHVLVADCYVSQCNSCGVGDDTIPPTASDPPDLNVNCMDEIPAPDVTVVTDEADNCVPPVVAFVSETISIDCLEKVTRIYSVTDECGNVIYVTHIINVIDNTLPTASDPLPINISCNDSIPQPDISVVTDATDNCSELIIAFVSDISNNSCNERITRTYSITDNCGNVAYVNQFINITDTIAPTADTPSNINVSCVSDVPIPDTSVITNLNDNCSTPTVSFISDISDNNTCPETISRTYRVTDECGNYTDIVQLIIISDDELPTASNPSDLFISCITDMPAPNINLVLDETDNCSIPVVTYISEVSDGLTCPETITRTYRVTDACGNFIDVFHNIIINDDILPTASNPTPIEVDDSSSVPNPDVLVVTDEADNCSIPTVTYISESSDNSTCPETLTRIYRVTDACGNFIDVQHEIIIRDTVLPTASNPSPLTFQCTDELSPPDPTIITDANDNASTPTVTYISESSDNNSCPEIITRIYRVTDACGNYIDVEHYLIIDDDVPPTASNPATLEFDDPSDVPNPDPLVVIDEADNCSIPTVTYVSEITNNDNCQTIYTRTYRVTDACGNAINVYHDIIVNDNEVPTASNPADLNISCEDAIPDPDTNIITDATDNNSTTTINYVSEASDGLTCPETITRTYRITDECGNYTEVQHQIIISDTIFPTASDPVSIEVTDSSLVPNPDVLVVTDEADNCSIPTVTYISESSNNSSCPEIITRIYRVTDACGNFIDVQQEIIINDTVLPTASTPTPLTFQCIDELPAPNTAIITDAADNASTPTVTFISESSDNNSCPEVITRVYRVTDACGNYIDVEHYVTIDDDIPPTASNPITLEFDDPNDVPNPDPLVVIDEADNCAIPTVAFLSEISTNDICQTIITRTYSVTDACDNAINVYHDIIVNDNTAPTASNPADLNISCEDPIPDPDTSIITDASDNYSTTTISYISEVSDNNACPETITRTYRITDECGNYTEVQHQIIISDTIFPTASDPATIEVTDSSLVPNPDVLVVTDEADNCSIPTVTYISESSNNNSCPETITRIYRVTDACGNFIDVQQEIIINDTVLPTASNPSPLTFQCIDELPAPNTNLITDASDNESTPTVTFISESSDNNSCPEIITRIYRVTDTCGNYIDVEHSLSISDDIPPTASNPETLEFDDPSNVPNPDPLVVIDEADNCSIPTVAFVSEVSNNDICQITITRTYSVTDACGNVINVYHYIIVNDNTAPTASNPADLSISCEQAIPDPDTNIITDAADNYSATTINFISEVSDGLTCPETITRTYRITDECGNYSEVQHQIIISDTTPPTASDPEPIFIECIEDIPDPNTKIITDAADNCSVPIVTFDSEINDNASCLQTITRVYTITDSCGNTSQVRHFIYIKDETPPEILTSFEPEITVFCDSPPLAPSLQITDNCSSSLTIDYDEQTINIDATNYDLIRTWTVYDECFNEVTAQQIVHVQSINDTTSKNISLCVNDDPIDISTFFDNAGAGEWSSDYMDLLSDEHTFNPSEAPEGTYSFNYNYISRTCKYFQELVINVNDNCIDYPCIRSVSDVKISKLVTPNGDNKNETFNVEYLINPDVNDSSVCDIKIDVKIFNRWGSKVYENPEYDNSWTGDTPSSASGSDKLPTGTYYYVVELIDSGIKPIQGYILLGIED